VREEQALPCLQAFDRTTIAGDALPTASRARAGVKSSTRDASGVRPLARSRSREIDTVVLAKSVTPDPGVTDRHDDLVAFSMTSP
jgi:hypothetical protein